jgi:hypothetical protein
LEAFHTIGAAFRGAADCDGLDKVPTKTT